MYTYDMSRTPRTTNEQTVGGTPVQPQPILVACSPLPWTVCSASAAAPSAGTRRTSPTPTCPNRFLSGDPSSWQWWPPWGQPYQADEVIGGGGGRREGVVAGKRWQLQLTTLSLPSRMDRS